MSALTESARLIPPAELAFDIDGVVADIMTLFIEIARDDYHLDNIRYQDITTYALAECLDLEIPIIEEIIGIILE